MFESWDDRVCDNCKSQEALSRHYCLLHSVSCRDMDVKRCKDWEIRLEDNGRVVGKIVNIGGES